MMEGYLPFEKIPEYCIRPDGRVGCPLAWNTQFCSQFSPKGLDMTGGDWGNIYDSGKRPDWCPIQEAKKRE